MPTFKERAISDMRIPGHTGSYASSYAPGDGQFWAGTNQWTYRSWLSMGRYVYTPPGGPCDGYNPAINPDYADGTAWETDPNIINGVYTQYLPWGQQMVSAAVQSPNSVTGWNHNTRTMFFDAEIWQKSKNTGLWTRLAAGQPLNDVLCNVDYQGGNIFNASDSRLEAITGGKSYRPTYLSTARIRPYKVAHMFFERFVTFLNNNSADVADVLTFVKVSNVLHNPAGVDDRDTSALMVSWGCDAYNPSGGFPIQPGLGISRPRLVRAKWPNWEWLVFHTMTEAQINTTNGLPPSLVNLSEGSGSVSPPPVDPGTPPTVSPTIIAWKPLATPRKWEAQNVTTTAPNKVLDPVRSRRRSQTTMYIKQNESNASRRTIYFDAANTSDNSAHTAAMSGADIRIAKGASGTEANSTGTCTHIANGRYKYEFAAAEVDSVGPISVRIAKTGVYGFPPAIVVGALDVYDANALGAGRLDTTVSSRLPTSTYETVDNFLDKANAIETGVTPRGAFRLMLAVLAGKLSGAGTTTEVFRNGVADTKARVTATVDTSGNRTAITTDQT